MVPHNSWTTAVNSLLPASSHGWSICTTSATGAGDVIRLRPSCYVASISLLSLSELVPQISLPLTPCGLSLSVRGCVGVCPWDVQPAREIWQAINSLKHFPSLSLILCALTQTHHRQYLCNMFYGLIKRKYIMQAPCPIPPKNQFHWKNMRWNNLINMSCWMWILPLATLQPAHSSALWWLVLGVFHLSFLSWRKPVFPEWPSMINVT